MKLGRVIGNVVATSKVGQLDALPIRVVMYLDENFQDTGITAACTDTVNANEGDIVILCASSSARMTARTREAATDNTIVGIVEEARGDTRYAKNDE